MDELKHVIESSSVLNGLSIGYYQQATRSYNRLGIKQSLDAFRVSNSLFNLIQNSYSNC